MKVAEKVEGAEMDRQVPEFTVTRVADGLGFGEGSISAAAQEQKQGNEDLAVITNEAIESPNILVPVDTDETGHTLQDDGCGDGRPVSNRLGAVFSKGKQFARSLHRPKVFGGGATMAAASLIGLGRSGERTLNEVMDAAMDAMVGSDIDFGAHTDNHAHGENCGCGAIDKAPQIVQAAVAYRDQIEATIASLGVNTEGLTDVMAQFAGYAESAKGQQYSGRKVMDKIVDYGKVVKELAGDHLETRVILNFVEGYTVNQEYVRQQTEGRAQVFAVDVWRLKQIAEGLYQTASEQLRAFQSMLVYTLATAAVLTKGDLPVSVIQPANQPAFAA